MDHDEARVVGRLMQPALAVGVRLRQVRDAALIIATPKYLIAYAEQRSVLDEQVKRGATLGARGEDISAGDEKAVDTRGTTLQCCYLKWSEPVLGIIPIRVGPLGEKFAER